MNPSLRGLIGLAITTGAASACATPPRHLFYLHGKIIEDQGPLGVSPVYGRYDYPAILAAFRRRGFEVVSEARPRGTDVHAYADKVVGQVRALLAQGVPPGRITVVGASKGAVIASLVSTRLRKKRVRYVMLANCNDWLIRAHDPRLTGEVMSIYETSDDIGQSCARVAHRSPDLARFREIALHTGFGHGIVYRPLEQWLAPAAAWAARGR